MITVLFVDLTTC